MRGRKNHSKPPTTNILPHCKVCGEPGTGFHYGVTTCGACKGFFRRSLTRDEPYECIRSQSCLVGPCTDRRQTCPKCRLDKCIAVGMCKEACKVGRYSLIKKSKDIEEVTKQQEALPSFQPSAITSGHINGWYHCYPHTPTGISAFSSSPFSVSANQYFTNNTTANNFFNNPLPKEQREMLNLSSNEASCNLLGNSNAYPGRSRDQICAPYHDNSDGDYWPRYRHAGDYFHVYRPQDGVYNDQAKTNICTDDTKISRQESLTHNVGDSSNGKTYVLLEPSTHKDSDEQHFHFTNPNHSAFEIQSLIDRRHPSTSQCTNQMALACSSFIPKTDDNTSEHITNDTLTSTLVAHSLEIISDTSPTSRGNEWDPKSDSSMVCNYETRHAELKDKDSVLISSKRHMSESEKENGSKMKRKTSKPDSKKISTLLPVLKENDDKQLQPVVLCVVDPDPMKNYVLSIFEKFPFTAFEKESVGPLLKLCYNASDWVDDYLPKSSIQQNGSMDADLHPHRHTVPSTINLNSALSSAISPPVSLSAQRIEYDATEADILLDQIKVAHCDQWGPECEWLSTSEIKMYLEMFSKICQLQEALQGKLNLIDDNQYFTVLKMTGIDVDKRKAWFSCTFAGIDESLVKDTQFFLGLPGFKDFSIKDRIALTKSASVIIAALRHSQTIDFEERLIIDDTRQVAFRLEKFLRVLPASATAVENWFVMLKDLDKLGFSFTEFVLLKAMILMLPEVCISVDNTQLVKELYDTYQKCLLHLVRKTHGAQAENRFNSMIDVLDRLRRVRDTLWESRVAMRDCVKLLSDEKQQPLLKEMFFS